MQSVAVIKTVPVQQHNRGSCSTCVLIQSLMVQTCPIRNVFNGIVLPGLMIFEGAYTSTRKSTVYCCAPEVKILDKLPQISLTNSCRLTQQNNSMPQSRARLIKFRRTATLIHLSPTTCMRTQLTSIINPMTSFKVFQLRRDRKPTNYMREYRFQEWVCLAIVTVIIP